MFEKVLVANRGEIAVRILRALRELEIPNAVIYSDADRDTPAVRLADEAIHIGPAPASDSYLRIDRIIQAARERGCDAIHPGYGFLSESADFSEACRTEGVTFIGPSPESIRALGSKTAARRLAITAGAPVVPGTEEAVSGIQQTRKVARAMGYPVLLKAAAGGGGKGMRRVDSEAELESALRGSRSEALRHFRSADVYIEKVVYPARHIEMQIIGDRHGNLIYLGERECSCQRRHQKVIEECPSPLVALHPEMRPAMGEAALKIARAAGYYNAGTAEFLVGEDRRFYFLEMNTRLQVEHPVTEMVTGLDIVHLQLKVAAGQKLPLTQQDVTWRGSAIECRLYAEDPENHFFPSPGRITHFALPGGPGIRVDNGVHAGYVVPMDYDPLLAKLVAWAPTREAAIGRMERALGECVIGGICSNLAYFRQILDHPDFRAARINTTFLETMVRKTPVPDEQQEIAAVLAAVAASMQRRGETAAIEQRASRWLTGGRSRLMR